MLRCLKRAIYVVEREDTSLPCPFERRVLQQPSVPDAKRQKKKGLKWIISDSTAVKKVFLSNCGVLAGLGGVWQLKILWNYSDRKAFLCRWKQFHQLFTIHADLKTTATEINVIPVAFALLQIKGRVHYMYVFKVSKEKAQWNPNYCCGFRILGN